MWNESGFADGGFFTEPNDVSSPGKSKPQVQRVQSVVPVCVRQLRDCQEDEFKLFGIPVQIVTLVGILKSFEVQSTKATYQIEDHTGSLEAVWWLENDSSNALNLPLVKEGCYLRIYGSIRSQENKKVLLVLRMLPVENINEITTHLLEVIHMRLEAENSENPSVRINLNNPSADLAKSMSYLNEDLSNEVGLTPLQQKVFNILKPITTMAGLDVKDILSHFPQAQHRDVKVALDFLTSEGHAYSTIDNNHFKVTENM